MFNVCFYVCAIVTCVTGDFLFGTFPNDFEYGVLAGSGRS